MSVVIISKLFVGDGVTPNYDLSEPLATTENVFVSVNGLVQIPTVDYTVFNSTLTFNNIPVNNSDIEIRFLKPTDIGPVGPPGAPGPEGPDGPTGYAGSVGFQGSVGNVGYQGSAGVIGDIDLSNLGGAELIFSDTPPTEYSSNTFWWDTSSNTLNIFDGTWISVGNNIDMNLTTGYTGSVGLIGYTGSRGLGFAGSSGTAAPRRSQQIVSTGNASYVLEEELENSTQVLVITNGLVQLPDTDYTVNGSLLTFVRPPPIGSDIEIRFFGPAPTAVGYRGSVGEPGLAEVFIGPDAPTELIEGMLWWDTDRGILNIYYEDEETWVGIAEGPMGDIGYTGSMGDLGYAGSIGAGYAGSQGEKGYAGSVGYVGSVGFAGSKGDRGYAGSRGEKGYDGSQGTVGFTGSVAEAEPLNYSQTFGSPTTISASAELPAFPVSTTITTKGNPVKVTMSGDVKSPNDRATAVVQLYRDNIPIGTQLKLYFYHDQENKPVSMHFIDTPVEGTYTYSFGINETSGQLSVGDGNGAVISALELTTTGFTGSKGDPTGYAGSVGYVGSIGYVGSASSAIEEKWENLTSVSGVVGLNCTDKRVFRVAAAGAWTANLTNLNLTANKATNVVIALVQDSTARIPNISINGTSQTVAWQGGSVPTGTANKTEFLSITILCYGAGSYYVFAQLVPFG